MKRSPLKRGTKPLKRSEMKRGTKPLPKQSKRRASQRMQRDAVVLFVIKRDRGQCIPKQRGAPGECSNDRTAHELIKRSQMRDAHLDVNNCVCSCWRHNGWIEDEPKLAEELGLVKHWWEGTR